MATVKRWDVFTPRPKISGTGTWWHRVGTALESDRGQITVYLDSVPLPDMESQQIKLMLFEPKDRGGDDNRKSQPDSGRSKQQRPSPGASEGRGRGQSSDSDDEIPF
jgi:hypothetical protein